MEEPKITTSAIISFAEKLEDEASRFYERLAERFVVNKEKFLAFANANKKNKLLVIRTYQETITDALEACFSFQGLNLNDYTSETNLAEDTPYLDALKTAMELEEKASEFYFDVAEKCKSLLATIPNVFRKVAERRNNRELELKPLLDEARAQF